MICPIKACQEVGEHEIEGKPSLHIRPHRIVCAQLMQRIAIMQPYFLPYAGYFRLMCDVDAFVVLSHVQFPRRGWVHRNRVRDDLGRLQWWTLPVAQMPRSTIIADMRYAADARESLRKSARRFEACRSPRSEIAPLVERAIAIESSPVVTIESLLKKSAKVLGLSVPMVQDVEFDLPEGLAPQERMLAICDAIGANACINAPGGAALYGREEFARRGVKLEFLPLYRGDMSSILQRLHESSPADIRTEILANLS